MTPAPDIGGATLALKAVLESDSFAATLDDVANEYPDGIPAMDRPAVVYKSEKSNLEAYPAIEILGIRTVRVSQDETVKRYLHQMLIVLHVLGDDEETLTARVQRGILAIRKTFAPDDNAGIVLTGVSNSGPVLVGDEDFEPIARAKNGSGPLLKVGTIEIAVPTWQ